MFRLCAMGDELESLARYGEEGGPPILLQERQFLRSLVSIIVDTMEQWDGDIGGYLLRKWIRFWECNSLQDVFVCAASILKNQLSACRMYGCISTNSSAVS